MLVTFRRRLLIAAALFLLAPHARATTLIQMNLADLAGRADKIFRGTVVSAKPGTVQAGGGQLPIVIYRLRVDEQFKGDFGEGKQARIVEIRMVGGKEPPAQGDLRHFSPFRDVPQLEAGREYVLFTTRPSAVGLSTTVGLGQGAFTITGSGKSEEAVNAFGNVGLDRDLKAGVSLRAGRPVPYGELASAIRAVVGE